VKEAAARGIEPPDPRDSRIVPGVGVEALVGGRKTFVGRSDGFGVSGTWLDARAAQAAEALEAEGKTVLPVVTDGLLIGWIALRDTVRPGVTEAIAALRRVGVKGVLLLTGDNPRVAAAVAKEVGVDSYRAGMLPEEKLAVIRGLQVRRLGVAVVSDGVNNAPALAAADIGIARGAAGTDVAIETADIALMSCDLACIPEVLSLARRALRVIRQTVFLSVVINLLAVVLVGLGIVTRILGAIIHEASARLVMVNAVHVIEWGPIAAS
jgi:P-type E1-E2 ATPase